MRRDFVIGAALALALSIPQCDGMAGNLPKPAKVTAPAGTYTADKAHTSLIFRVNHMGFSNFTGRLSHVDIQLQFDPAHPAQSKVDATIDPLSLETDNPPAHFLDELHGASWLDAAKFPAITFHSTRVVLTGSITARITGDFTLHGETHPIVLNAKFNGGYSGSPMDPRGRVGFSLRGSFKRSAFGMGAWVPKPGTTFGVGDVIEVAVESELGGPAWNPKKSSTGE